MSIDLLHAAPLFLASLGVVVAGLFAALIFTKRAGPRLPWIVTGIASLLDLGIANALSRDFTLSGLGWSLLSTLLLVSIPVALGSRRIARLTARGTAPPLAYAGGLLLGVGVGWILLPVVLVAVGVGLTALTS
jgi:hypothetical protein